MLLHAFVATKCHAHGRGYPGSAKLGDLAWNDQSGAGCLKKVSENHPYKNANHKLNPIMVDKNSKWARRHSQSDLTGPKCWECCTSHVKIRSAPTAKTIWQAQSAEMVARAISKFAPSCNEIHLMRTKWRESVAGAISHFVLPQGTSGPMRSKWQDGCANDFALGTALQRERSDANKWSCEKVARNVRVS